MPRTVLPQRIANLVVHRGPQVFYVVDPASGERRYEVTEDGRRIHVHAIDGTFDEDVATLREAALLIHGLEHGREYAIRSDAP